MIEADLSIDGYKRRLAAMRSAVQYRNPETGWRHFCHLSMYRKAFVRSIKEHRNIIKRLEK